MKGHVITNSRKNSSSRDRLKDLEREERNLEKGKETLALRKGTRETEPGRLRLGPQVLALSIRYKWL